MLEMQLRVYEGTKSLDEIPEQQRDRQVDIQAGKLSLQEPPDRDRRGQDT